MHEKLFSIQIFQYFRQIPPRVCTLVLFIIYNNTCILYMRLSMSASFTSGYACPVYSIHLASTETMAFTIIISGSAIFLAELRPFYTRHYLYWLRVYMQYTLNIHIHCTGKRSRYSLCIAPYSHVRCMRDRLSLSR